MIFWTKFVQKGCFRSKTANTTIEFCIFELVLAPNFNLNWQFYVFRPNLPNKYAVFLCGIHQTMYAALASRKTEQYSNRKSKNFENITFYRLYAKVWPKIRKIWVNPNKTWVEEKSNSNTFYWSKRKNNFSFEKSFIIVNAFWIC